MSNEQSKKPKLKGISAQLIEGDVVEVVATMDDESTRHFNHNTGKLNSKRHNLLRAAIEGVLDRLKSEEKSDGGA